jgi:hypothetical protein
MEGKENKASTPCKRSDIACTGANNRGSMNEQTVARVLLGLQEAPFAPITNVRLDGIFLLVAFTWKYQRVSYGSLKRGRSFLSRG